MKVSFALVVRTMGAEEDATIKKSKLKISPLVKIIEIRHVLVACMGQGLGHHQKFS